MTDFNRANSRTILCPICKEPFCLAEGMMCDCMGRMDEAEEQEAFCVEGDECDNIDMAEELDWQCECGGHIREN